MAKKRKSLGSKLRQLQSIEFVGRKEQLKSFRENLKSDPDNLHFSNIFNVYGQGGVGKTTLLRKFEQEAKEYGALIAYTDEGVRSVPEYMSAVAIQLEKQGKPLKKFQKRYEDYRQHKEELEADPEAPQGFAAFVGRTLVKGGTGLVKQIPVAGAAMEFVDTEAFANQAGEWATFVAKKLTNKKDDVQLMLKPERVLTPIWLEELGEYADEQQVCLLIDTYENTGQFLDSWFRKLLEEHHGEFSAGIVLVIAGRKKLDANNWSPYHSLSVPLPVEPFTEAEALDYLARRGITHDKLVHTIINLSGRLPVLLATLAEISPQSVKELDEVCNTAVERFLKWEDDPSKREAALYAAVPRFLNQDILAQISENKGAAELFNWLRSKPFIQQRAGRWAYHPVVREQMLRYFTQLSPKNKNELHQKLAGYFEAQQNALGFEQKEGIKNEKWQELTLEVFYHQYFHSQQKLIPYILDFGLFAIGENYSFAKKWAEMLAGVEISFAGTKPKSIGKLLNDLFTGLDDNKHSFILQTVEKIEQFKPLSDDYLYIIPRIKADAYSDLNNLDDALASYDKAIEINPEYADAFYNRGTVLDDLGRKDDALASYDKAIEINPEYASAFYNRGTVLSKLGRKDDALASYDKAIEINPEYASAFYNRGNVLDDLGRKDDALASYDKAIEINPEYASAFNNRGTVLDELGRKDDALASYDKAIEINPEYASAFYNRGNVLDDLGRKDDALASYDKAIEINPEDADAFNNRGNVLSKLGRKDDALASYDKAIEINPEDADAFNNRGTVLSKLGRKDDALASYDKAIEINPEDASAFYNRGTVLSKLGRKDDALASYDKAIEINPEYASAFNNRGTVLSKLGRKDDALASYDKAIEINPEDASAFNNRGTVLSKLGRKDDALASYDKAIEINPEDADAFNNRGTVLSKLGRKDDALASYDKAIEINPEYASAFNNRGTVLSKLGRKDDAIESVRVGINIKEKSLAKSSSNTQLQNSLANDYGGLAWLLLFVKQFKEAEEAARKGLNYDSSETWINTNLALAYLFQGYFDNAAVLYNELKDNPYNEEKTFRDAFLEDFIKLEEAGVTHPDVEKIRALLKLEKPG